MFRRGLWILVAFAVLAGACSNGTSREDGIQQLVDLGMSREAAACFVDEVTAAGFSGSDISGDNVSPEVQQAGREAMIKCASGDDMRAMAQNVSLSDEERRGQFVDAIMEGTGSVLDRDQAECVLDYLIDQGVTLADMIGDAPGAEMPPKVRDLFIAAIRVCVPS